MNRTLGTITILSLLAFIAITGCEEAIDPDNPFVERLVVNSTLTAGDTSIRVSFSKTLPLDRPAVREQGWLDDLSAVIVSGRDAGTVRLPLRYSGDSGIYVATGFGSLIPGYYRLEAEWHGLRVVAETTVPRPVPIEEARIISRPDPYGREDSSRTFDVRFRPLDDNVYRLSYRRKDIGGRDGITIPGHGMIARRKDTSEAGEIVLAYDAYLYDPVEQIEESEAVLHTIDAPYYDFFQTYYLRDEGDGPFSTGSDLTRWNVQGDGIGMFIGQAISTKRIK
jgi:hypothetical protein